MSRHVRIYVILAWTAFAEVVLLLNVLWPQPGEEESWPWVGGLMAFPIAAALILIHRPGHRVGWALGVTSVSAGLIFLMYWYAVTFPDEPLSRHAEAVGRIPAVGQFLGIVTLLYLFPTGRSVTVWFARALIASLVVQSVTAVIWVLSPSPLISTDRPNPLGVLPEWLGAVGDGGAFLILPFALGGIWSLAVRWRRAQSIERAQMKWFLSGAVFLLAIMVLVNSVPESSGNAVVDAAASALVLFGFWSMPAAIVLAVLRYRLYDIDRIINRTLVYVALTAGLGAIYFGLVVGLQALLRPFSGGSDLAIVATTLVVAALFLPARRRVQNIVDRRFNRRSYDAARTVEAFSARLREQVDLDTLRGELLAVVNETMQPARASVWLRGPEARR